MKHVSVFSSKHTSGDQRLSHNYTYVYHRLPNMVHREAYRCIVSWLRQLAVLYLVGGGARSYGITMQCECKNTESQDHLNRHSSTLSVPRLTVLVQCLTQNA